MFKYFLVSLIIGSLSLQLNAQNNQLSTSINCDTTKFELTDYLDSLAYYKQKYGRKRHLHVKDEKLKLAFYVALSYYPELKDLNICLKLKAIPSTMQAQPEANFIFRNKKNRSYKILVNNDKNINGMFYKDLSFNSLVGWIGHELAHVLDYSKKDNIKLLSFITSYVFSRKDMKKTEREADIETIKHGLGTQLLDGINFFHRNKKISKKYKKKKQDFYLSPQEIIVNINENCKND